MTRPKASPLVFVGALAAAGVGTLLWCAWLILTAPLPTGAATAAWVMWLLCVAALVTLVAYLRELVRHRVIAGRGSWKPLPGLLLLWVAGLTALVAFPFALPQRASGPSQQESADGHRSASAPTPATTGRPSPAAVSRSSRSTTASSSAASSSTASSRPQKSAGVLGDGQVTSTVRPTAPSSSATGSPTSSPTRGPKPPKSSTPTPSSSTSTPILDITLPPAPGRPTDKPPRGR